MASNTLGKASTPVESSDPQFSSPTSPTSVHLGRSGTDTTATPSGVKDGPGMGGHGRGGGGIFGPRARAGPGWFRRDASQLVGEFFGTFLFLFLAYIAAQVAIGNDPHRPMNPATLFYVAAGFGGALLVALWMFRGISGEMFNPAITIGLFLIGAITPFQMVLNIIVQLLAAICAAALAAALTPGPLLVGNALATGVSPARGLFVEALMTAQLILAVFLLSRPPRPHPAAHVGIALSLFMAHLASVNFTGTGINPARSLGPDVVSGHFKGTAWVYYVGPILGSLIATAVFALLRVLQRANGAHSAGGGHGNGRSGAGGERDAERGGGVIDGAEGPSRV